MEQDRQESQNHRAHLHQAKREKSFDEKYCNECGEIIKARAEICPHCGVRQKSKSSSSSSTEKNRIVAALLAFFIGVFGIHKFYLGRNTAGILYLLFFWTFIPALLAFFDTIILLLMSDEKFAEKYGD